VRERGAMNDFLDGEEFEHHEPRGELVAL